MLNILKPDTDLTTLTQVHCSPGQDTTIYPKKTNEALISLDPSRDMYNFATFEHHYSHALDNTSVPLVIIWRVLFVGCSEHVHSICGVVNGGTRTCYFNIREIHYTLLDRWLCKPDRFHRRSGAYAAVIDPRTSVTLARLHAAASNMRFWGHHRAPGRSVAFAPESFANLDGWPNSVVKFPQVWGTSSRSSSVRGFSGYDQQGGSRVAE
ncbi:hypothetical protein PM082_000542 [Marasmius tenuissimus]|nr:hypothetical protein PM082_000542 [Marasmius tenuissimus]